jgi:imidazolonepropionase-like amidohydrolase
MNTLNRAGLSRRNIAGTLACLLAALALPQTHAQVAVKADLIYTMAGPPVDNGVIVIRDGKIAAIGPADTTPIPDGYRVLTGRIATPGLIDSRSTLGLTGIYNQRHDQDMLEHSAPIQPQLRAIDAYNPLEPLIEWIRSFGITTVHTGHGPGELISGQTTVVKLRGKTIAECVLVECAAVAATLDPSAQKDGGKSPGTRAKMMAMLRQELIKAREYSEKRAKAASKDAAEADSDKEKDEKGGRSGKGGRDLSLEVLERVLKGELPLLVTANHAQDIANALRLAEEFRLKLWLDSGAEAYLMLKELKKAGVPVFVHPTMARAFGTMKNMTFGNAALLRQAGIPVVFTSGYEDYVPKVRVVLFEAALAGEQGLALEQTLAMLTIDAAKLLGVDKRVGSLEVGKDGDVALYDGNPFEYTSHCIGTVIEGEVVWEGKR